MPQSLLSAERFFVEQLESQYTPGHTCSAITLILMSYISAVLASKGPFAGPMPGPGPWRMRMLPFPGNRYGRGCRNYGSWIVLSHIPHNYFITFHP